MTTLYKKQFATIKKYLKIEKIISIRFANTTPTNFKKYTDTACTALARSFKNNIPTYIDRKNGQLCPGGNYFLNITHPSKKEICNTYVRDERIFQNNPTCLDFLKKLPKYPTSAKKRYILINPLNKETNKPNIILLLATPAQTSKILGLSAHQKISYPLVFPALPTCASMYTPIESNQIHLNFIDYYDRYYQGKQNGKLLWKNSNLIISLSFSLFEEIIRCIPLSAHGNFKPKIKPYKIDCL